LDNFPLDRGCNLVVDYITVFEEAYTHLAYMPYAPIKEGFRIGTYEVWPFHAQAGDRVGDEKTVREIGAHLGRFFKRDYNSENQICDKPVDEVFMVSPLGYELGSGRLTSRQIGDIKAVCHAVAFSALNEPLFRMPPDAFALVIEKYHPGHDGVTIWQTHFETLDSVKFMKPYHLDSSFVKYEKTELCAALGNALGHRDSRPVRRVFKALELFCQAALHDAMLSDEHRLLMLVMCFEILLGFKNKNDFAKKLEQMIEIKKPHIQTRSIRIKKDRRMASRDYSAPRTIWWAYDLYELRSDIVHCRDFSWDEEKYGGFRTRLEFGKILLRKLIKNILVSESLWSGGIAASITDLILDPDNLDEILEARVAEFREKGNE
jgi:hypothetical protein